VVLLARLMRRDRELRRRRPARLGHGSRPSIRLTLCGGSPSIASRPRRSCRPGPGAVARA
jgi:hypothetical protein